MSEVLLSADTNRMTIFPIKYHDIWNMYQKAVAAFWVPAEVDLTKDMDDWNALSENERFFIKNVLAFFGSSDTIVNINLGERFLNDVQIMEAKFFYGFQITIENIHSEMYSLLIDTYIKDVHDKDRLFNAIQTIPCVKTKADWCFKWISDTESSFAQRLLAFAIVEGVFFSGAFASIFWLKEKGVMPGLAFSNELISRDEALHVEFALLMYSMIQNRLPQDVVHAMIADAVKVEKEFITESIPCSLLGMNSELMCTYIEFVADRLLLQCDYERVFNVSNPFPFMDRISIQNRTNFFESRVSEYSKANVGLKNTEQSAIFEFDMDADF